MLIVYGPKPGSTVIFPLTISPPREVVLPDGRKLPLPEKKGVGGDRVIKVTAKVPTEAQRRSLSVHLERSTTSTDDGKLHIVGSREAYDNWRFAAIRELVVHVDDLKLVDPSAPDDPEKVLWIHSAEDVITYADDDVINALADVVTDRLQLGEILLGNSERRSSSSPAATQPQSATAEIAERKTSADPEGATAHSPKKTPT